MLLYILAMCRHHCEDCVILWAVFWTCVGDVVREADHAMSEGLAQDGRVR